LVINLSWQFLDPIIHVTMNPQTIEMKDSLPIIIQGPYQRDDHATLDEVNWIYETIASHNKGTIVDVGAHKNSFFGCFANAGWKVQAVEPFSDHYETLRRRWQNVPNVKIHGCAISNTSLESAPFYKSSVSDGIHSLSAFDPSHGFHQRVQVKTLTQLIEEEGIRSIDLLKIDVEGLELEVLEGMCWDRVMPECVVCEFDAGKFSGNPGRAVEIMEFLLAKGYHVLVSHWHRVLRYGIPHDWKALGVAPGYTSFEDGWGNFIAIRDPEVLGDLGNSVRKYIRFRPKEECLVPIEGTIELSKAAFPGDGSEKLVIFGAGGAGIQACRQLAKASKHVAAFIDNDPAKHHCMLMGRPVFPVEYLKTLDYDSIVVSSQAAPVIYDQLISLGVDKEKIVIHVIPSAPNLLKDWRESHSRRLERFRNCHAGEDCFILGNGPSLLKTDLGALSSRYVFGLNKIHLLFPKRPLHVDYHVAINSHVVQQCGDIFRKQDYTSFLSYKPAKESGLKESELSYHQAHLAYQRSQPTRRIFDATVGGALEVFPKLPFEEAVAMCRPKSGRNNR
jgi:FkbM family methyltransferase